MSLPNARALLGMDVGEDEDDLADTLREFHGHMQTGNYKAAADAYRAAHSIASNNAEEGDELSEYEG